jgi:hypothetical protein
MRYLFLRLWLYRLSPLFHQGAQISELINLSTLPLSVITCTKSSCTAIMTSGGERQMHGQSTPVQRQAEPSWQDGAEG